MSKNTPPINWFESWFNSKYYHILYKNRNSKEAELFIDNLIAFIKPSKNNKILDIACGKGRHAVYMNQKGFDVIGIDLSENSITEAKKSENDRLRFFVHDMRINFCKDEINIVTNLFTSIGYFEDDNDNLKTFQTAHQALKKNGLLVIDFLNTTKTIDCLAKEETKEVEGISFHIKKNIHNNFINKQIEFSDEGKNYTFCEKVKALSLTDFEGYLNTLNFKVIHLFGDYSLNSYDKNTSDRLIIIAQK